MKKSLLILLFFFSLNVYGAKINSPRINFTDLISGPSVGLKDGKGSGVIVTIWGQHLGSIQNDSKVVFKDSNGVVYTNSFIYYWKNADGVLPSGPSNLYKSHLMHEIAFSIPSSALGLGSIYVIVDGVKSNELPFTVRTGAIYHIKSTGSDSNAGSFDSPFLTIKAALSAVNTPGSTIYIHDSIVNEPKGVVGEINEGYPRFSVYWNNRNASSTLNNQFGIIAYPNSQPIVIGRVGFKAFKAEGQVVSKFYVRASDCEESPAGKPINCYAKGTVVIEPTKSGRIIANKLTDREGGCANGQLGAIGSNGSRSHGGRFFGNEIYEYGCSGTSKFHHTTYMSIRDRNGLKVDAWEFGWNYLHDNHAKNGIHNYDQPVGVLCGTPVGVLKVHNNLIVNQAGAGINTGTGCEWDNDFKIFNNILINTGLASTWDGIDPTTSFQGNSSAITVDDNFGLLSKIDIYNNTIINWNSDNVSTGAKACFALIGLGNTAEVIWRSNSCVTDNDKQFIDFAKDGVQFNKVESINNNWFYTDAVNPLIALIPNEFNSNILGNPSVSNENIIKIGGSSILKDKGLSLLNYDFYGFLRTSKNTIGAVEYFLKPNPVTNLQIK